MKYIRLPSEITKNIIIIAPTGSGKTYSTLLAIKHNVIERKRYRKAVVLEPTKALMYEVYFKAQKLCGADNVGIDNSDARLDPKFNPAVEWAKPITVTSYEKFDSVIVSNPLAIKDYLIVLDEAHNLLFSNRATSIIDILATLKYNEKELGVKNRIILLSATMPEPENLASYLDADIMSHNERPVDLKIEKIVTSEYNGYGAIPYYAHKLEYIKEKLEKLPKPILIYAPSRRVTEYLANILKSYGYKAVYHHAGLPLKERRQIEEEIRKKNCRYDIVVATDTLSQGVNFAFRTVVVLGLKRFLPSEVVPISPAIIAQVIGRAGRPEYGEKEGYGVIVATPDEEELVEEALRGNYSGIAEPDDYLALTLRLLFTGKNIDVWIKYAYNIDGYKIRESLLVLRDGKYIDDNNKLLVEAYTVAREYLPGIVLPVIRHIIKLDNEQVLDPVTSSIAYTSILGYFISGSATKYGSKEASMKLILGSTNTSDKLVTYAESIASALVDRILSEEEYLYDITRLSGWEDKDIEVPTAYFVALTSPNVFNIDSDLEAWRKATTVVQRLPLRNDVRLSADILHGLVLAYRRLMRTNIDHGLVGKAIAKFLDKMDKYLEKADREYGIVKFIAKNYDSIVSNSVKTGAEVDEIVSALIETGKKQKRNRNKNKHRKEQNALLH